MPGQSLWSKYRIEVLLIVAGLMVLLSAFLAQHTILRQRDESWFVSQPQPTTIVPIVGVPLDDVYIHCRFAQNLLAGHGFSFNPGEALSADTAPLWVLLIAFGGLFTDHLDLVAVVLSSLFFLALGPGVYRIARDLLKLDHRWAIVAGVLTVLSSRLMWSAISGMEVSLAALLVLLVVEEHARQIERAEIRMREGILLGLGLLTRPEFALLLALCIADWGYKSTKCQNALKQAPSAILALLIITLPWFGFNLLTRNSLLSHSSFVQSNSVLYSSIDYLVYITKILLTHNALLLLGALAALVLIKDDRWRVGVVFMLLLPIIQAIVAPQTRHHGRYIFPILPLIILFGSYGIWKLLAERSIAIQLAVSVLLICWTSFELARWLPKQAFAARNINDQHVAVAQWVKANTTSNDKLAVHDVGMLGYLAERPVLDLTGLITPAMFPLQSDQTTVWSEARKQGANIFVIYNRLNPTLYNTFKDSLELLAEFRIRKPIVSSADTVMSAYRVKGS